MSPSILCMSLDCSLNITSIKMKTCFWTACVCPWLKCVEMCNIFEVAVIKIFITYQCERVAVMTFLWITV